MRQQSHQRKGRRTAFSVAAAVGAALAAGARAEQVGDTVTISWSGATFMRSFTTSRGISLLNPGTAIVLNSGPGGTPVTYSASNGATTSVQLAPINLGGTITPNPNPGDPPVNSANYNAIRFEWHEQGSVEGISELINDQIGNLTTVSLLNRNGNSGNPLWINSNPFGQNNVNVVPSPPPFGTATRGVDSVTVNGHIIKAATYNTYTDFDDSNPAHPGRNIYGGQNRVQFAVSDVNARQGFATAASGTSVAAWFRIPGTAGYGLGNPALPLAGPGDLQGVGHANVHHEFNNQSVVNMDPNDTSNGRNGKDPTTGQAYAVGAWNTAGVDNLKNYVVANGGLAYVANPGTGLERINRSDNIWLHTTGRLANGADFNVVTRDAYSGTLNTAAANLGLDPSWVMGENDDGNTNATDGVVQTRIGDAVRFSGKTSGGQGVRPTVQNSRMGFGHLSSSDSIPSSKNGSSRPIRSLDYRDDDNDLADGSNNLLPAELRNDRPYADPITGNDSNLDISNGFTRLSAKSIIEGSYAARTNQTYVTARRPNAAEYNQDLLKGDNNGNDVRDFRDNILNSVANFPASSVANPADQLLNLSYMLPQLVKVTKDVDGLNRDVPNPSYNASLSATFLATPSLTAPFNADDPATIRAGTGGTYGNNNIGTGSATPVGGVIPITDRNFLFGDFDQTGGEFSGANVAGKKGIRDFSDLAVARSAQAQLFASGLGVDWNANAGSNSSTNIAGLPAQLGFAATKGDLIVLGDFNSDGRFDGKDLYLMARGTSLADSSNSAALTIATANNFGDMIRKGVLRKNAALDLLNTTATPQQKIDASASPTNDPTGANAFNKLDVNRDGLVSRFDAKVVDGFQGKDYRKLDDQLSAVITDAQGTRIISLVDAELNDTGDITRADFDIVKTQLVAAGKLIPGDANFDGIVNVGDLGLLSTNFGSSTSRWGLGDFNGDGIVNVGDLGLLSTNFGANANTGAPASPIDLSEAVALAGLDPASVPEPSSIAAIGVTAGALLRRRRK